jgi:hypothetical protein
VKAYLIAVWSTVFVLQFVIMVSFDNRTAKTTSTLDKLDKIDNA